MPDPEGLGACLLDGSKPIKGLPAPPRVREHIYPTVALSSVKLTRGLRYVKVTGVLGSPGRYPPTEPHPPAEVGFIFHLTEGDPKDQRGCMVASGLEASVHRLPAGALGGARGENARIALAGGPGSSGLEDTRAVETTKLDWI